MSEEVKEPKGIHKPKVLSAPLADVCGATALSRPQVVKALWVYIKANGLQDKVKKKNINNDPKMQAVFAVPVMTMFEMNKFLGKHLT